MFKVYAALAGLHTWLAAFMLHMVYAGAIPDSKCTGASGASGPCITGVRCDHPDFSEADFTSVVSEVRRLSTALPKQRRIGHP